MSIEALSDCSNTKCPASIMKTNRLTFRVYGICSIYFGRSFPYSTEAKKYILAREKNCAIKETEFW